MSLYELKDYFIEEAEHCIIEDTQGKQTESVMQAQAKKNKGRKRKGKSDKHCENCDKARHVKDDCWAPGGGKEGQGLNQEKKGAKGKKKEESVAKTMIEDVFTFTCTSTFVSIAD